MTVQTSNVSDISSGMSNLKVNASAEASKENSAQQSSVRTLTRDGGHTGRRPERTQMCTACTSLASAWSGVLAPWACRQTLRHAATPGAACAGAIAEGGTEHCMPGTVAANV